MEDYPQLLNLIPLQDSEDTKLQLRLGQPGGEHQEQLQPVLSLNNRFCKSTSHRAKVTTDGGKAGVRNWLTNSYANCPADTALFNSSKKRAALPAVVGWPPVRSFRKNIHANTNPTKKIDAEESGGKSKDVQNSLYVKINMDGIPIGRKVDLKAYDNYERLSSAVDELFRGLLAAQGDSYAGLKGKETEKTELIKGLLDGNGEYTLVYEDNEGDRILVGDVPWEMFISSTKRLRVLKRSELPMLHRESN